MDISRAIRKILFLFLILATPTKVISDTTNILSRLSGGPGGAPFVEMVAPGGVISNISIRSGKFIDSIQLTYKYKHPVSSRIYGGNGGKLKSFTLRRGEYITEFGGKSGKYIDSIYIKTNKGRMQKWGGSGGNRVFRFTGSQHSPIQGIWGRSGGLVDAIGVIRSNRSGRPVVQSNLMVFKPDPDKTVIQHTACDTCDSYTKPIFPTLKDKEFWLDQNKGLYTIIRRLSQSANEFNTYINTTESEHCSGLLYCEIDTRIDLIINVMGAK